MSKKQEKEQINLFTGYAYSKILKNPSLKDEQIYRMAKANGIKISKEKAFKIINRLKSKYKKEHKISKSKIRKSKFQNYAENKIKTNPDISANKIIQDAKKQNISIRRQEALAIIKEYKKKYKGYKKVKKKKKIGGGEIHYWYFGRIKYYYIDRFGIWRNDWITTKTLPSLDLVRKEMDIYEQDLIFRYDIKVEKFLEVFYEKHHNYAIRIYQQVYRPKLR